MTAKKLQCEMIYTFLTKVSAQIQLILSFTRQLHMNVSFHRHRNMFTKSYWFSVDNGKLSM